MTAPPLIVAEYPTPFGSLVVIATPEDGVVRASGFDSVGAVAATLPSALAARSWTVGLLPHVGTAVSAWLAGDGSALTDVHARQDGSPFFQRAWAAMREIPAGQSMSYAELAEAAGNPRAARAAGTACARNALAPFVPCHRVVRSGGALGNYGYGLAAKAAMLVLEGERPAAVSA